MEKEASTSLIQLGKLIDTRQTSSAPLAFAIYKLLNEANIPDDDIQNIGAILTDIASGE
jgi:glutamine synthetase type III